MARMNKQGHTKRETANSSSSEALDVPRLEDRSSLRRVLQLTREDLHNELKSPTNLIPGTVIMCYLANLSPFNKAKVFVVPSYTGASQSHSGKGSKDLLFLAFYLSTFLALRRILVYVLYPRLATYFGARPKSKFSNQLFQFTYFSICVAYGIYVSTKEKVWHLDEAQLLGRLHSGQLGPEMKYIYLVETAWWIQETVSTILGQERRKDFNVLLCHHVLTMTLLVGSYWYNLTDYGLMIFVPHGATDAFLSLAKMLTYTRSRLINIAWLAFLGIWIYARHYLMFKALVMMVRCYYSPIYRDLQLGRRMDLHGLLIVFCVMMQGLNLFWLVLILRGLRRAAAQTSFQQDIRSEDEHED